MSDATPLTRTRLPRTPSDSAGSLDAAYLAIADGMQKDGMVSKYSDDGWRGVARESDNAEDRASERGVEVTQQFRERHNMTYELDCSGVSLVLRVYFPEGVAESSFRIDACCGRPSEPSWISTSAGSRALALQRIAQSWRETAPAAVSKLDWDGITQAMTSVGAI